MSSASARAPPDLLEQPFLRRRPDACIPALVQHQHIRFVDLGVYRHRHHRRDAEPFGRRRRQRPPDSGSYPAARWRLAPCARPGRSPGYSGSPRRGRRRDDRPAASAPFARDGRPRPGSHGYTDQARSTERGQHHMMNRPSSARGPPTGERELECVGEKIEHDLLPHVPIDVDRFVDRVAVDSNRRPACSMADRKAPASSRGERRDIGLACRTPGPGPPRSAKSRAERSPASAGARHCDAGSPLAHRCGAVSCPWTP